MGWLPAFKELISSELILKLLGVVYNRGENNFLRSAIMECQLCQREMEQLTIHHLVPRQSVKRKKADPGSTVKICSACHRQIHVLFDNATLAREYNTLEKLQQEPRMEKFLRWVKKQNPRKKIRVYD